MYELLPDPPQFKALKVSGLDRGEQAVTRAKNIEFTAVGQKFDVRLSKDSRGSDRYGIFSPKGDVGYLPYEVSEIVSYMADAGLDINKEMSVKVSNVTPVSKRRAGSKYALMQIDVDFSECVENLAIAQASKEMETFAQELESLGRMEIRATVDGEEIFSDTINISDAEGVDAAVNYLMPFLKNPDEVALKRWVNKNISVNKDSFFLTTDELHAFAMEFSPDTAEWEETATKMNVPKSLVPKKTTEPLPTKKTTPFSPPPEKGQKIKLKVAGVSATGKQVALLDDMSIQLPYKALYTKTDQQGIVLMTGDLVKGYSEIPFTINEDVRVRFQISINSLTPSIGIPDSSRKTGWDNAGTYTHSFGIGLSYKPYGTLIEKGTLKSNVKEQMDKVIEGNPNKPTAHCKISYPIDRADCVIGVAMVHNPQHPEYNVAGKAFIGMKVPSGGLYYTCDVRARDVDAFENELIPVLISVQNIEGGTKKPPLAKTEKSEDIAKKLEPILDSSPWTLDEINSILRTNYTLLNIATAVKHIPNIGTTTTQDRYGKNQKAWYKMPPPPTAEEIAEREQKAKVAEERKKEEEYHKTVALGKSASSYNDYTVTANTFKAFGEYKDAEKLTATYENLAAKAGKKRKLIGWSIFLAIALAITAIIVIPPTLRNARYNSAVTMHEAGNYLGAIEIFQNLGETRRVNESQFALGVYLMNNNDFAAAEEIFNSINSSHQRSMQFDFNGERINHNTMINNLHDAEIAHTVEEIRSNAAALRNNSQWDNAVAAFEEAHAIARATRQNGLRMVRNETNITLPEHLNSIEAKETRYMQGEALLAQEDWAMARWAFDSAGDFSNAPTRVLETHFLEGQSLLAAGDMEGAHAAFILAENFEGAAEQIFAVMSLGAENFYQQGDFLSAAVEFINAGNLSRAREIIYREGTRLVYESNHREAMNFFNLLDGHNYRNSADYVAFAGIMTRSGANNPIQLGRNLLQAELSDFPPAAKLLASDELVPFWNLYNAEGLYFQQVWSSTRNARSTLFIAIYQGEVFYVRTIGDSTRINNDEEALARWNRSTAQSADVTWVAAENAYRVRIHTAPFYFRIEGSSIRIITPAGIINRSHTTLPRIG